MSAPTSNPLSQLCLACGLCCDGTLFARVPISSDDAARLALFGISVETRPDGSVALPQRCAALNGCECRAYAQRPTRCREYQCNLYSAVQADEVDVQEALRVVAGAHQRVQRLSTAAFGVEPDHGAVMTRLRQRKTTAEGETNIARGELAELDSYLDRHFRGRR